MKTFAKPWPAILAIFACTWGFSRADAQVMRTSQGPGSNLMANPPRDPNDINPSTGSGLSGGLQQTPEIAPGDLRPLRLADPKSARDLSSLIQGVEGNDAHFEVIVGQGRILTTAVDISVGKTQPLIAIGDPSVIDFTLVNNRQLRVTGRRIGVTDLSITNGEGKTATFEVRVVADLNSLRAKLDQVFPDAHVELNQIRNLVVLEGQARDVAQVTNIVAVVTAYLRSIEVGQLSRATGTQGVNPGLPGRNGAAGAGPGAIAGAIGPDGTPAPPIPSTDPNAGGPLAPGTALPEINPPAQISGTVAPSQIVNLLRVPNSQQVLLKVRIAELNRTSLRQIGSNFLGVDPKTGSIVGSNIAGSANAVGNILPPTATTGSGSGSSSSTVPASVARNLTGTGSLAVGAAATIFGIFQDSNFEFTLNALRSNGVLKILAEPNLVALHGQRASFLAGGEFPVPVPQVSASGTAPTVTVNFKQFGVQLGFLPYIMDGDIIRLSVTPEVSNIDNSVAVTLVAGGSAVPGLNTRRAQTTVELRQGQTLAIAGLLQLQLNANTNRIPGLGDLPIIGPFFSNVSSQRTEKELVVLVTPYLIEPMDSNQVSPTPDENYKEPNDLEFFFLGRIEARTGRDWRSTTGWADPFDLVRLLKLEKRYVQGPSGFSD